MSGIPAHLHQRIRSALLECGPFDDNNQIRDLFMDARLSPWRFTLPSRDNIIARVEAYIAFLAGKHRADNGQNALVLLLCVLSDRLNSGDECGPRLTAVADELAAALKDDKTAVSPARPTTDPFTSYENGLRNLETAVQNDPDSAKELGPYIQRLRENISRTRRYGDTSDRRADRAEIIDNLDSLARTITTKSFDDWCHTP